MFAPLSPDAPVRLVPPGAHIDAKFAEAERLVGLDPVGRTLYRRLSVLRTRLSTEGGLKPYHVFTNRQLLELSERRPHDLAGLADVSGFGAKRIMAYGDEILATIRSAGGHSQTNVVS